jgi:hypothetical protein
LVVFFRVKTPYHLFMMNIPLRNAIPFDRPATYQISVQGLIDPDWSDRLGGMTIGLVTEEACPPVTTLKGELSDQAALAGVLNTLYELHLPVLSVLCLSYPPGHRVEAVGGMPVS